MNRKKVFISSVQSEFAEERKQLCDYIRQDALLGKFFEPFIFEELPAINFSAQDAYFNQVRQCDIYVGILGQSYGYEDADGVSPTEREYDLATQESKHRLVFLKECDKRHPKEAAFVKKVEQHVVRRSFSSYDGLRTCIYEALVRYMEETEILRLLPWDATYHHSATLDDIDPAKVENFVRLARAKRGFKIPFTGDNISQILTHLNLMSDDGRMTNSALLLFAKNPQKFFVTSEVKCMVFPTHLMTKPILSYQVYQGGLFELIDQAKGFVMQHIDAAVGTRTVSTSVDITYEIPAEVISEAIVNACVHRSYESNGSVQVMLFRDRLEIWNPGTLPFGMTPEKLKQLHSSMPVNPILAAPVYLAGYIERAGTGTTDMVDLCRKAGLPDPEFIQDEDFRLIIRRRNVTPNVTPVNVDNQHIAEFIPKNVLQSAENVTPNVTPKMEKNLRRMRDELEMIMMNRHITAEEIAAYFGVTIRTVRRDFNSLRSSFRIEWIPTGATSGYWEVETKKTDDK